MAREQEPKGPSNSVGLNRYLAGAKRRVMPKVITEDWYTARLVNPESESIDRYAADVLMRVTKIMKLKSGAIKIYATPVQSDSEAVGEEDAVPMNSDGYFIEDGEERGYLLDAFGRQVNDLGSLAVEAIAA